MKFTEEIMQNIRLHTHYILQSDRISIPPDYIKNVLLYEHVMNL